MVYFYTSRCGLYTIYMGKDKHENELLIQHGGWADCDVWFHVDDLSSAHVYLRLLPQSEESTDAGAVSQPKEVTLDDIPPDVLLDCCSLVKANSIVGCKVRFLQGKDRTFSVLQPLGQFLDSNWRTRLSLFIPR
jgi:NFACT protein RNA binding domain